MKIEQVIQKAERLRLDGYFKESLRLWTRVYKRAIKNNFIEITLDSLIVLGDLSRIIGNFKNAELYYNEAIELSDILQNQLAKADALTGLCLAKKATGSWRDALQLIRHARRIYKNNKDKKGIAFSYWAEGTIWRFGGRIKKSLEYFYIAQTEFKKLKDKKALAYAYCGIGGSSRVYGSYEDSMKYYKMANQIFKELGDRFGIAYSFCGIGNAFRMLNDFNKAEKNFKEALNLYAKIGDIVSSSYTLWSMAMLNILKKQYTIALHYIEKLKKILKM